MATSKRRSRFFRFFKRKKGGEEDEPCVKEPLGWHEYTADVATNKKQTLKLGEPLGNLTFHVHFRRLRCAKQRAQSVSEEALEGPPATSTTQTRQSTAPSETATLINTAMSATADITSNRTRFATDPFGNIRKLDAPRARQDYFSISRSVAWQSKIVSRLQVYEANEKLHRGRNSTSSSMSSEGTDPTKPQRCTAVSVPWDEPVEQGSILFTAAADDPFSHEYEARRRVCTSAQENVKEQQQDKGIDLQDDVDDRCQDLHISACVRQPLASIVNRGTTEMSQGFYILADLNWEQQDPSANPEHCILLCVKAFKDGTVQLHPPVEASGSLSDAASKAGSWPYKVHDRRGGVYEYRIYIQSAQASKDSVMARRDALWSNQERAHAARAQRTMLGRFIHFNGTCVCIRGDILSAGGFERNSLYVEFSLRYSKALWTLRGPKWLIEKMADTGDVFGDEDTAHVWLTTEIDLPEVISAAVYPISLTLIAGCTQICTGRWVEKGLMSSQPGEQVSHFSHPFEYLLELDESKCQPQDLAPTDFPTMFFEAWRPALSMEQRIQEFYIGGAPELQDVGFVRYPAASTYGDGSQKSPLVKIGTPAEVTGWVQVSTHVAVHYSDLSMHPRARGCLMLGQPGKQAAAQPHRQKLETLEKVVEHATRYIQQVTDYDPKGKELHQLAVAKHTARLKQKHGIADEEELTVVPEAVVAVSRTHTNRPRIVRQPQDVQAVAGVTPEVTFHVRAQGEGLTYQWCKDGNKLDSETATSETLVVRNPEVNHIGFYSVIVSNEAGNVKSARCRMIVQLDTLQQASPRTAAASTGEGGHVRGGRAAARRRRMLDGAVARAHNPVDAVASTPASEAIVSAPSLLVQPAESADTVESFPAAERTEQGPEM